MNIKSITRTHLLNKQTTTPTPRIKIKAKFMKPSKIVGYGVFGTESAHEYWNATTVNNKLKIIPDLASICEPASNVKAENTDVVIKKIIKI